MKRIFLTIIAALSVLFFCGMAFADGSCVQTGPTIDQDQASFVDVSFLCTGDASAGTVPDTAFSSMGKLYGLLLYQIETVPGSGGAQPTAYTVAVKNARGTDLVSLSARSTTLGETVDVADEVGGYPAVNSALTLDVGDLGNSDQATIVVTFYRLKRF